MKLSNSSFLRAKEFIYNHGRKIDIAWFEYHFIHHSTEVFMKILEGYQYENGGFGGLVTEFEYAGPCLKSTEHAFRYIFGLKERPDAGNPTIQKMMKYILERYQPELGCWGNLLVPEVNEALHVWWWEYKNIEIYYKDFDSQVKCYNPNGQAALAAFVALYSELISQKKYKEIISCPVEKVIRYFDKESPFYCEVSSDPSYEADYMVPYNIKCYQQFINCLQADSNIYRDDALVERLKQIVSREPTACMELEETDWADGYHETPCDIVTDPDSFLYPFVKKEVDGALDYLIRRQDKDGGWHLTYQFGEQDEFRKLERQYEANMTVLYLAELKNFHRIDIDV
nr:hypothetical protein [uncultured Eisenbergiella sp.]